MFVVRCIPADLIWILKHGRQIQLCTTLAGMNLDGARTLLWNKQSRFVQFRTWLIKSLRHSLCIFASDSLHAHTLNTTNVCVKHAITSSPSCSVSCTPSYPRFCWRHFGSRLLFHWLNKDINSLQIQLAVRRVATEHERQHLKRFPANSLLPGYRRLLAYIFSLLLSAISLRSEVRGLCRNTKVEPPRHLAESK